MQPLDPPALSAIYGGVGLTVDGVTGAVPMRDSLEGDALKPPRATSAASSSSDIAMVQLASEEERESQPARPVLAPVAEAALLRRKPRPGPGAKPAGISPLGTPGSGPQCPAPRSPTDLEAIAGSTGEPSGSPGLWPRADVGRVAKRQAAVDIPGRAVSLPSCAPASQPLSARPAIAPRARAPLGRKHAPSSVFPQRSEPEGSTGDGPYVSPPSLVPALKTSAGNAKAGTQAAALPISLAGARVDRPGEVSRLGRAPLGKPAASRSSRPALLPPIAATGKAAGPRPLFTISEPDASPSLSPVRTPAAASPLNRIGGMPPLRAEPGGGPGEELPLTLAGDSQSPCAESEEDAELDVLEPEVPGDFPGDEGAASLDRAGTPLKPV